MDVWTEQDELVNWLLSTLESTFRTLAEQLGLTYTRCRIKAILADETPLAHDTFLIPQPLLHHTESPSGENHAHVTFPDQEEVACLMMQSNKGAE